jgi:hypothetical protein
MAQNCHRSELTTSEIRVLDVQIGGTEKMPRSNHSVRNVLDTHDDRNASGPWCQAFEDGGSPAK